MERLKQCGARLKKSKCQFFKDEVDYLGYRIDKEGLHPMQAKVEAITGAPTPRNIQHLRAFLGLLWQIYPPTVYPTGK